VGCQPLSLFSCHAVCTEGEARSGGGARNTQEVEDLLMDLGADVSAAGGELEILDLREEPRCERSWRRDETVRLRSDGGCLSDRDAEAVGVE